MPHAPSSSISPITVSAASLAPSALENTSAKLTLPNCQNMIMIATDRPKSPTRFTTNAFFAAAA